MRALLPLLLVPLVLVFQPVQQQPPKPAGRQVRLNGHVFTLPEGFDIELAAKTPLVDRPITAAFDEQGRLYVADSSGSNDKVVEQLQKKPHRIVRLEDTNGDGVFDRRTVFADRMPFPEGTMWLDGSLYVAAPPSIWKLTDTDGDGVADRREEWFKGKTLTGCANDLHGPYAGPDGWIYWCKGAFASQTYERPGRKPLVTRASHIFRCRPDGTGIEPVMTGGMDNPVDVVFTPGGERIFTTTFFQHPGGGRRDGLIHAIYGGIYGKDHEVIYDHPWTAPTLMPVLTHLGPAAPAGLERYQSAAFGPDHRDNLFAAVFNLRKVTRHVLEPEGATFRCRDFDFVVSDNLDFHPTDVVEDADGSLLIVDTGGWYKICCPTSQLHKPDVLGAIYRVRRKGAARPQDPRGLKLAWDKAAAQELGKRLGDERPAVRRRAIQTLAQRPMQALPVLREVLRTFTSVEARRNAVWTATRIDRGEARALVRLALQDSDESVRQCALHSISLWRDEDARKPVLTLLESKSPHNRRAAAEALGRMGGKSAVPALLAALAQPGDRLLEHSLIYALIEINDAQGTSAGLQSQSPAIRRAALVALDQMESGGLQAKTVAAELDSTDPKMQEIAWWILGRHPEWADALAGFVRQRLSARETTPAQRQELTALLARFAGSRTVQKLLADRLRAGELNIDEARVILQAMAGSGLRSVPEAWIEGLTAALRSKDNAIVAEAAATVRALPVTRAKAAKLVEALLAVAEGKGDEVTRVLALAAIPGGPGRLSSASFELLLGRIGRDQPIRTRSLAAEALSRSRLDAEHLLALARMLREVGPMEIDRLLDPFTGTTDDKVGRALLDGLRESPAKSALRPESVLSRLAKCGPKVRQQAEALAATLDADAARQRQKLDQLLARLKNGDVRRGQAVFNSPRAACISCHAIGYVGGKIGPDLTRIGGIRTERDLLESIVFPSASFVRSYEPVQITTRKGIVHNGLIKRENPDEIILTIGADQEVRIPRASVAEMLPGKLSIMPAGMDQQLTVQELADLVAFLKACK